MASALLGPLCQQLVNPISEEYKLVSNVKEEINKLRFTVSLISGVLQDAEEKQVKEVAVGIWLRSLRQVLYDAEDVLDEVATDAAVHTAEVTDNSLAIAMIAKVCDLICSSDCIHQFLSIRDIAHQIKEIRLRLDDLSKEKDKLGLRVLGGSNYPDASRPRRPDTTSLLADASCVIGRDVEKERIIQILFGSSESSSKNNIAVIAIVGMGGLGKTTLAKAVFNDPRVKQYFQPMMWVCVSDDFDVGRITINIIDELSTSQQRRDLCDNSNLNTLQKRLQENVEGKRFLLVLDDVWEHNDHSKWESLCDPLRYGGKQSKIIVTTRDRKVSEIVKGIPIFLTGLSSENLWSIFEKYAFDGCDPHNQMQLENVGKEIVEKLKGSPLAAKTIGKLLNTSLNVSYWKRIIKVKLNLLPKDANDITSILKLSYDHLPGNLKQCFAYCSLFPKDYHFDKNDLVRLWMAQSLVQTRMGHLTENIGSEYFDDLLYKSFFEHNGRNKFMMMHDLMHDLAESVSEDDCFRLEDNNHKSPSETVRHISLHTKDFDLVKLKELCKHGKLRALLFFKSCTFGLAPHLDDLFVMLKRLRALRLCECDIKELPESIGLLKHLRLLDISWNPMSELPESLCNLHNLQVLDLEYCRELVSLPSNMSALINLRHLLQTHHRELVSNIQGLGKLTALQELRVRGRILKEVANMGMLRELTIEALEEVPSKEEAIQARLGDKEHLDVLRLEWRYHTAVDVINPRLDAEVLEALQPVDSITQMVISNYAGVRYPRWLDDRSWVLSCSLERLQLAYCKNWEVLPPLIGQLRCLKRLEIIGMDKVRRIGPELLGCSTADGGGTDKLVQAGFPSLEWLEFRHMREWEEWDLQVPAELDDDDDQGPQQQQPSLFPHLRELRIRYCPKLRQLPPLPPTLKWLFIQGVGLTSLPAGWLPSSSSESPSLSSLTIWRCPNLVCLGPLVAVTKDLTINNCPKLLYLEVEAAAATYSSSPSSTSSSTSSPPLSPPASCVMAVRLNTLWIRYSSPQQIKVWLLHCPSLQRLYISECPELRDFDGDAGGDHIGRELEVALLNLAPSLRILEFSYCRNLVSLPTKLRCLSSLRSLSIESCPQIKCLPAAGLPESLQSVSITRCPALKERCQVEEQGPESPDSDWHLISRIPDVKIKD